MNLDELDETDFTPEAFQKIRWRPGMLALQLSGATSCLGRDAGQSGAIIATGSRRETLTLLPNEGMPRRNASPARTEENARLLLLSGLSDYMISRLR